MKTRKLKKSHYLKPEKIIRDLVHGYINLTRFDLELIDTVPFQRLGDIRQLTCQHVYPGARHTRFEHSLGVLELMRSAIKYLNRNGIIGESPSGESKPLIDESLEFNACVAALLHDVGHCPFSHMGETEFDKDAVKEALVDVVQKQQQLQDKADLIERLQSGKNIGAVHEQLSCIVILEKYADMLLHLDKTTEETADQCDIAVDLELIIRSILGIEYDVSTVESLQNNRIKNIIVRLLNSKVFDVDKLDYIIRDSHLTGIGTPAVDTQRLFRNMYLDKSYTLVFTSRAVPALQNMIDARDGLYLYVYNHHAVVYSDFLNTYISRRLSHNAKTLYRAIYPGMEGNALEAQQVPAIPSLGIVPKQRLFSVDAVKNNHCADSDWLSMLNSIHNTYLSVWEGEACLEKWESDQKERMEKGQREALEQEKNCVVAKIQKRLEDDLKQALATQSSDQTINADLSAEAKKDLAERIFRSMQLVRQAKQREYLKPWWKTVFEFSSFMHHYFQDDRVRKQVGKFICKPDDTSGLKSDEFRSQIAKHVVFITQKLDKNREPAKMGLLEPLSEGDFFVIQRAPRFFEPDTIEKIEIALKSNEILGMPTAVNRQVNEYYIKTLTNIIPQKDYSSIYAKEGFYIFSRQLSENVRGATDAAKDRHYKLLERIFAFVAKEFVNHGEQEFISIFQNEKMTGAKKAEEEENSKQEMYKEFLAQTKR